MMPDLAIKSGNKELDVKLAQWLAWDKNEETMKEMKTLVSVEDWPTLGNLLLNRLVFGTAGLRGVMRAGFNAMNDLVVLQSAQGLLKYVQSCFPTDLDKGIVVGYDGRYNSKRFAELTSAIFIHANIPVYLFTTTVATPFVPHAVKRLGLLAGVMVTASHNPKEDNGYKVYWNNGAQISTPHDKNIQKAIENNLEPFETSWDTSVLENSLICKDPLADSLIDYYNFLGSIIPEKLKEINYASKIVFTYTAMHGVGYPYVVRAFEAAKLNPVISVQQQQDPDPDFPTVKFPNPEEGKSSLDLSFRTAHENNSSIILANDPDADRLACAEKQSSGNWKVFTGNELGALIGWWSFKVHQMLHPDFNVDNIYTLASTVSSKMLHSIAKIEGFHFIETLTGFKWMGNEAVELIRRDKKVIFAFEEAIGFMWGSHVLDKDGVSAAAMLATLVCYLDLQGVTLAQQLTKLHQIYGYHVSDNSYYICHDQKVIHKIFQRIRNFDGKNTYPPHLLEGKYPITSVRDLTTGYDSSQPDLKAVLPCSKSSQMITFNFDNGLILTLRTSGTEPKLKYYTELCAKPEQKDWTELGVVLREMVSSIIDEFLQPVVNGLIERTP